MGMGQLEREARLADPRLAHDGDHLPVPTPGLRQRTTELLDLGVSANEAREPASRGGLKTGSHRADPDQLVHVNGGRETLQGHGAERVHPDETLRGRERVGGQEDRADGQLLHPGRQMRRLPHGAVVHP